LFHESLCRHGFLGIGSRETLGFSALAGGFDALAPRERIYQKRGGS
jgi:chemotaxis protein methyltransferase CheR